MIHVTAHACERYVERVAPHMTVAEASAAIHLHTDAIECAARFGCSRVKLGNGAFLRLEGYAVVTVLARSCRRKNVQIAWEERG